MTTEALLRTGAAVRVRAATAEDIPELEVLHDRMSAESLRHRFFGTGRGLAHTYLEHLAHTPDAIAVVAIKDHRICGLGTAEPLGGGRAEVSFVVDERSHGLGIGTLLLESIAAEAAARGIRELVAEVLVENHEMLDVFRHVGFAIASQWTADTVRVSMQTKATAAHLKAAHDRRAIAEAHLSGGPVEDGTSCPAQSTGAPVKS